MHITKKKRWRKKRKGKVKPFATDDGTTSNCGSHALLLSRRIARRQVRSKKKAQQKAARARRRRRHHRHRHRPPAACPPSAARRQPPADRVRWIDNWQFADGQRALPAAAPTDPIKSNHAIKKYITSVNNIKSIKSNDIKSNEINFVKSNIIVSNYWIEFSCRKNTIWWFGQFHSE